MRMPDPLSQYMPPRRTTQAALVLCALGRVGNAYTFFPAIENDEKSLNVGENERKRSENSMRIEPEI
jgi:hypothetical protein